MKNGGLAPFIEALGRQLDDGVVKLPASGFFVRDFRIKGGGEDGF